MAAAPDLEEIRSLFFSARRETTKHKGEPLTGSPPCSPRSYFFFFAAFFLAFFFFAIVQAPVKE
jgi:hypothetical protein